MQYLEALKEHKPVNLYAQLKSPTLVRVDINLPVANGRVAEDALRLRVYSHVLELYSYYTGLVVMGHQGRKGDDDFLPLKEHHRLLLGMLPRDIDVEFIPHEKVFTEETKQKIAGLEKKQIILLDNVRYFPFEKKFDPDACQYIDFFKGTINTCINDAMPAWHRADSSVMVLPHIANTLLGLRSVHELNIIEGIMQSKESKAWISGGKKLQKISDLQKVYSSGVEGFTGGVVGQLIAWVRGNDLGEANNRFIERSFTEQEFDDARIVAKLPNVSHPQDFTVAANGDAKNIELKEMARSRGQIVDIGSGTVEHYAHRLEEKEIRIRAGPLGIYERGFTNGVELTKRIAGTGLVFLGGDTSQEVVESGLDSHITSAGGELLISGGAAIHRLAGGDYPSLDEMLRSDGKDRFADMA